MASRGLPDDEGVALLDELKRQATREEYQYRMKYGIGDLVIWDNASLLHSATLTAADDPRTLWRITVKDPSTRSSLRGASATMTS